MLQCCAFAVSTPKINQSINQRFIRVKQFNRNVSKCIEIRLLLLLLVHHLLCLSLSSPSSPFGHFPSLSFCYSFSLLFPSFPSSSSSSSSSSFLPRRRLLFFISMRRLNRFFLKLPIKFLITFNFHFACWPFINIFFSLLFFFSSSSPSSAIFGSFPLGFQFRLFRPCRSFHFSPFSAQFTRLIFANGVGSFPSPPSSLLSDIETNLATVANSAMHWALSRKKKVKMKEFGPWNGVQYRSNRTSNQTARAEEERSGGVVMTPETRVELAMLLI